MEYEIQIKEEVEKETNGKMIKFEDMKTEIDDTSEETRDTLNGTESLSKKFKYKEELDVDISNQYSHKSKGRKNVRTGRQTDRKGKQQAQRVSELKQERGAKPGPSMELQNSRPVDGTVENDEDAMPLHHWSHSPLHGVSAAESSTDTRTEPRPVEDEAVGADAGSDVDGSEPPELGHEGAPLRPPTLATDSRAVLPDNMDPRIIDAIKEMDAESDTAMKTLLPDSLLSFDWRPDLDGFTAVRETFTGKPGPTFEISEMITPAHAFLKIWDQETMNKIAEETNEYAARYLKTARLEAYSRVKHWRPTTADELYVFFAVMMHQTLSPCTGEAEYFYPTCRVTAMPFFKEYLSYDRLFLLKKFLHFVDNSNIPDGHSLQERKIYKIQPMIDHLNQRFQTLYSPGQNVVVDASVLKWNGHLPFVQQLSARVARSAIKSCELYDSETGYMWKFIIYTGKDATTDRPDIQPACAPAKIVYDLASPLFHKGHTLIIDNFYNSPLLARCLKSKGMDCYGTLRLIRDNVPASLKATTETQLRTGEVVSSTSGDLNIVVWRDNNLVSMLSTYHNEEVCGSGKHGIWQYKPRIALHYNKSMCGVDKMNQLMFNFPLERRKGSSWYKKMFWRLVNASLQNAFLLYRCKDSIISERKFLQQVADGLLDRSFEPRLAPRVVCTLASMTSKPVQLEDNHFSVKIESESSGRASSSKRCVWCSLNRRRSRTTRQCDVCGVALCLDCMIPYHTGMVL